jgi:hypothetical protein
MQVRRVWIRMKSVKSNGRRRKRMRLPISQRLRLRNLVSFPRLSFARS